MRCLVLFLLLLALLSCAPEQEPNGGELCKWDLCWHMHKEGMDGG